ncbi:hypothetical protein BpHYR1_040862 [Brachionus plicatilis]|uniref:Uncharacterized protein n=1 Tax=Brachionus plicatilis TaxID=10195 RepID=A0A3M7PLA6_BRAPC|nr:hypothetical protein BpHYR1_040862 [Brachionus plicatilis]
MFLKGLLARAAGAFGSFKTLKENAVVLPITLCRKFAKPYFQISSLLILIPVVCLDNCCSSWQASVSPILENIQIVSHILDQLISCLAGSGQPSQIFEDP